MMSDFLKRLRFIYRILPAIFLLIGSNIYGLPSSGCWFQNGTSPISASTLAGDWKTVDVEGYFRIHYSSSDPYFEDSNKNDVPDRLEKQLSTIAKSRHFLETELGWPLPASHSEMGKPRLDVYLITAGKKYSGSVYQDKTLHVVLNRALLRDRDFGSYWIHQLGHAAALAYKTGGEFWFYEATAGWMEGQFQSYSAGAERARQERLLHPEVSLTDSDPDRALGTSRFLDILSRPIRDVIRQTWEQLSYTRDANAMETIRNVLAINHLPDLDSYLQNYYLLFPPAHLLEKEKIEVELQPYSAMPFRGSPEGASGGAILSFAPDGSGPYSTTMLFYAQGERSGTLAMKKAVTEATSSLIPFAGLDHYRFTVVNGTEKTLRGTVSKDYDASVPGTLEYFRVNPEDGGVQIEWKTAKENGVAFWNLYRMQEGRKEKLNDFPIPAAIHSEEGIHYMYLDVSAGSFYTLEAITNEGFQSPFGVAETPQSQ